MSHLKQILCCFPCPGDKLNEIPLFALVPNRRLEVAKFLDKRFVLDMLVEFQIDIFYGSYQHL